MLEKIVFFDGDGVTWNYDSNFGSSWVLAAELLVGKEKKLWEERRETFHTNFKDRDHEQYKTYIEEQFELIRGKDVNGVIEIPYTPGFKQFSGLLEGKYRRILLSGGFWPVLDKARKYFDDVIGNFIEIEGKKLKDIRIIVTPFNKPDIIKRYSRYAKKVLLFVDLHEYGIFNDREIIKSDKYEIYLINPKKMKHDLSFILEEFENFYQAIKYFAEKIK